MRVINVFEESRLGGPQIYTIRLILAVRNQIEMVVLMPEEDSEIFFNQCIRNEIDSSRIPICRLSSSIKDILWYFISFPVEVRRLMNFINSQYCDVVYVCGGSWQYKGVIAGRLAGKKVVWNLNDSYLPWGLKILFRLFSHFAHGFIFASERTKDYYLKLLPSNRTEYVIPGPVDTSWFNPNHLGNDEDELILDWKGKIVIGTVANISPIKGLETLIYAAQKLNDDFKNLVFVVVGFTFQSQMKYMKQLKKLASSLTVNNLVWVGERFDTRTLLKRFDIFLCTSKSEAGPMTVYEAMSMEKPVVSTNVGAVPIYVKNGYNGFIVPVGDFLRMAKKLNLLIKSKSTRNKFGKNSREIVINKLDSSLCANRHREVFKELLDH